jgi:hypothetical protein
MHGINFSLQAKRESAPILQTQAHIRLGLVVSNVPTLSYICAFSYWINLRFIMDAQRLVQKKFLLVGLYICPLTNFRTYITLAYLNYSRRISTCLKLLIAICTSHVTAPSCGVMGEVPTSCEAQDQRCQSLYSFLPATWYNKILWFCGYWQRCSWPKVCSESFKAPLCCYYHQGRASWEQHKLCTRRC